MDNPQAKLRSTNQVSKLNGLRPAQLRASRKLAQMQEKDSDNGNKPRHRKSSAVAESCWAQVLFAENLRFGPRIFRVLVFAVFHDVLGGNNGFLEATINLAQFPVDRNKENRDHEQQELDIHFFSSLAAKEL